VPPEPIGSLGVEGVEFEMVADAELYIRLKTNAVREMPVVYYRIFGREVDVATKSYLQKLLSGQGCHKIVIEDLPSASRRGTAGETRSAQKGRPAAPVPTVTNFDLRISCAFDDLGQQMRTLCTVQTSDAEHLSDAVERCNPSSSR